MTLRSSLYMYILQFLFIIIILLHVRLKRTSITVYRQLNFSSFLLFVRVYTLLITYTENKEKHAIPVRMLFIGVLI